MNTESTSTEAMQQRIAGYWRELLGVENVNPTDDFIGLGGNSMLATVLGNRIEDELGIRPSVVELFATLEKVAAACVQLISDPPDPNHGE